MPEKSSNKLHPFFTCREVHGNIVFNFRGNPIEDIEAFAAGYHEAGKALVARMEMLPGYRDYEGYPILFLYRHALELYVKAIILKGTNLLWLRDKTNYDKNRLWRNHHLREFLPILRSIFDATIDEWQGEPDGFRSFNDFERLIRGIEDLDPNSYCFRYPVQKEGKPTHQKHLVVNVIHFARKMDPVLDMLDAAVTYIDETWQLSAEVEYFLQELAKKGKA